MVDPDGLATADPLGLGAPAARRLAFRELGLAIGLAAAERLGVTPFPTLREQIQTFWLVAEHRRAASWTEHQDINDVMLATSLAPDGYLVMPQPPLQVSVRSPGVETVQALPQGSPERQGQVAGVGQLAGRSRQE